MAVPGSSVMVAPLAVFMAGFMKAHESVRAVGFMSAPEITKSHNTGIVNEENVTGVPWTPT